MKGINLSIPFPHLQKTKFFFYDHCPPHFQDQFFKLLNINFQVPKQHSFLDDFPIYHSNAMRLAALITHQKLISACGVFFGHLQCLDKTIPIRMLGGVCTDAAFQGQGFARFLLKKILFSTQNPIVTAATILWSTHKTFYQKLGFQPMGKQYLIPLSQLSLLEAQPASIQTGWHPAIFDFMQKRKTGLVKNASDQALLPQHKNVLWFTHHDLSHQIDGFIGFERGIDLQNTVHEWGGKWDAIQRLLYFLRSRFETSHILANTALISQMGLSLSPDPHCWGIIHDPCFQHLLQKHAWFWGLDAV